MKNIRTISILLVALALLVVSACGGTTGQTEASFTTPTGTGSVRKANTLWIVNLQGSYYDMGRQYGALLGDELRQLYADTNAVMKEDTATLQMLWETADHRERGFLTGVSDETGLAPLEVEALNATLFYVYSSPGCSVLSATQTQTGTATVPGTTIAGRNFDNPKNRYAEVLSGRSVLVIYNPRDQFTANGAAFHRDNSVAAMTQMGWFYGLTLLNSRGIYLEYNNGTNSINSFEKVGSIMDGLHQNLYAAFDSDTLDDVDARLSGPAAVATLTQVADRGTVRHYERSPYEPSKRRAVTFPTITSKTRTSSPIISSSGIG
jgi:hypothetical protein